ncbi:MAG TPA: M23 family metallopeptidase [Polyangia bacterium]|jgi:murein DD-endopeptidase MepM/ murein hydrolase activator NlpD
MIDPEETRLDLPWSTAPCEVCSSPLPATRYVHVEGWTVSALCSEACLRVRRRESRRARWSARRLQARRLAVVAVLGAGLLAPHAGPAGPRRIARTVPPTPALDPGPPPLPAGWFGPVWPPTDASLLAALGEDAWIHPLSGPVRRMPRADSRVFGAVRPGERPAECVNGHCGVDLGGEIWGEHVHAVHDGVVDFVQRNANPDRGGEFVRLSHREGTVFTQYFHLAAIPRGLERGVHVKSGDVIGLVGDTGVKQSAPHLHFAISVRPWKDGPERYIDPEPLIALWPVRVPVEGTDVGLYTTLARPGLPLGAAGRKRKAARVASLKAGAKPAGEGDGEGDGAGESAGEETPPDTEPAAAPDSSGDE